MKTKVVIESNISEVEGMDFLYFNEDANGWFMTDKESIQKAIREYGDKFPEMFISDVNKALKFLAETVTEAIARDLNDIWKRLDNIENK